MSIFVGADQIKSLYVGAEKIVKAYVGEELVFSAENAAPSRLPAGYTEVEYIESNGNCFIETNITPRPASGSANTVTNSDTKIVVDIEPLDAPTSTTKYIVYAFSQITTSGGGTSNYWFDIYWATTAGAYFQLSKTKKTPVSDTSLRRMVLELDGMNGKCRTDGAEASFTDKSLAYNVDTIKLLGGKSVTKADKIHAKLYSCQIYKGTNLPLVCEFVPCINPSGAVGLYDLVRKQFYAKSGYGTLTPGPAV